MSKSGDIEARLKRAEWLMRPETQRILALLDGAAGRTRAVGGIVRDTLLDMKRADADIDLATELLPDEVTRRAQKAGLSVYPTGIEHGTVTLKLDALTAEVTTLREDVETDGRHAVVKFGTDWRADAMRRDFTLNALYAGMDGTLFDPLHGLDDCLNRRVLFIGSPAERIAEDRLRVYRFFRFSASHGNQQLNPEGLAACAEASSALGSLAAERVGAEMRRMLALPRVAKTIAAMCSAGILDLPGEVVSLLVGYDRRARKPSLHARLALLAANMDRYGLQTRWRLATDDIAAASAILNAAYLIVDFRLNEVAYRFPAALTDAVDVAATLADWGDAGRLAVVEQLQRIDVPRFPLNGNDLIAQGYPAGKALGMELERLERYWIESGFALDRQALLEMIVRP